MDFAVFLPDLALSVPKRIAYQRSTQRDKGLAMMTLVLPRGHTFGWGVCGKYLARELAKLAPVRLVTQPFDVSAIGDEFEYHEMQQLAVEQGTADF